MAEVTCKACQRRPAATKSDPRGENQAGAESGFCEPCALQMKEFLELLACKIEEMDKLEADLYAGKLSWEDCQVRTVELFREAGSQIVATATRIITRRLVEQAIERLMNEEPPK